MIELDRINPILLSFVLVLFILTFISTLYLKIKDKKRDEKELDEDKKTYRQKGYNTLQDYINYKNSIKKIIDDHEEDKNGDLFDKFCSSVVKSTIRGGIIGIFTIGTLEGSLINAFIMGMVIPIVEYGHVMV